MAADLVIGAIGVRPDVRLAEAAGLALGPRGGISVSETNQTNDPDIYAVGDAVEKADAISHATSLIALANVANRQGRRVADHIAGRPSHPVASLGTAIVKVFDLVAATVGWNERRLRTAGRSFRAIHSHPFDHATYYPGATRMATKLIFDPNDGTILGAQIVGRNGVDKRIDVIATAMAGGITADRLADLELAYAPPFSSAKDPVNLLGYMAENVLSGDCDVVDPNELAALVEQGWILMDVRTAEEHAAGAIPGSINVPIDSLRDELDTLSTAPVVVYCEVGQRGHTATALMHELGNQSPQPRRRLPNLDSVHPGSGPATSEIGSSRRRRPRDRISGYGPSQCSCGSGLGEQLAERRPIVRPSRSRWRRSRRCPRGCRSSRARRLRAHRAVDASRVLGVDLFRAGALPRALGVSLLTPC